MIHRSALRVRTRVSPRIRSAGRDWSPRQVAAARVGHGSFESRVAVGATSIADREIALGTNRTPRAPERGAAFQCRSRSRAAHEQEVDKVLRPAIRLAEFSRLSPIMFHPAWHYVQWDERLDAMLTAAVMSLQAVKAVEIGSGIQGSSFSRLRGP